MPVICRNRDFTAPAPNQVWVMDFTYVTTWAGFVYVAFIVDVFAQKILAWRAQTCKEAGLVTTPLRVARGTGTARATALTQDNSSGTPMPGPQYTSLRFAEHCELDGIRPAIGAVGDAFDNALMETVIGLYKTECIRTTIFHNQPFRTLADVRVRHRRLGRLVQQRQAAQ